MKSASQTSSHVRAIGHSVHIHDTLIVLNLFLNSYRLLSLLSFSHLSLVTKKELEQMLSCQEEATSVARMMQSKLTKFRELEKENEKLKEDNHYYRWAYTFFFICSYMETFYHSKYMLFTGREVRIGKNCARGLEYGPRP